MACWIFIWDKVKRENVKVKAAYPLTARFLIFTFTFLVLLPFSLQHWAFGFQLYLYTNTSSISLNPFDAVVFCHTIS